MLPGKTYKPEDYLQMVWNRRWFIAIPFGIALVGAATYARVEPNRYRAQTAIVVTPQQVPKDYVRSTVTTLLSDRLQLIREQILSRARLERVIEEFNLYPEMRTTRIMEDVVEQMRSRDIRVNIAPNRRESDSGAFTVSYESENPRTALLVTERLASLFIRENTQERAVAADATSQFLDAELEEARRKLIEQEKKLEEYKRRHSGTLPTQVQSNLQGMQSAQLQIQNLQQAAGADRDRQLFLERALADAEAEVAANPPAIEPPAVTAQAPAAERLEAARAGLRSLELRLKPEHPDVLRTKRVIRDLEREAEAEALRAPVSEGGGLRPLSPAERNRQARISSLKTELDTLNRRMAGRAAEEQKLRTAVATYQARLEVMPARETEMTELMRDYDTLKMAYDDLLRKGETSKLALNLERRQIGEQFKIIDAARLPERPVSPNRPRIILMGALAGLGLGLALIALLEYRDSSVKTDEDVAVSLALPVLAMIPAMVTKAEEQRARRRRRLIAVASLGCLVLVCGAAAAWKLELLSRWIG